ncbi:MucBP domain-containing protein, partial [Carnobacterium gallinarum]
MKKIYKISVVLVLGIQLLVNPTAKILALGDTEKSSVNSDRQNSESTSSDTYKPVEIKEANKESIKAEGAETSGNEVSEESPLIEPEPEPEPESKPIPTATNETNEGSPEPEPVTTDASTKDTTENIAARAANIASGTVGTSPWYLTSDGVLHIGAGELVNTTNSDSPWGAWNEKIISVVLDGPVKAAPISESLFSSFYNVVSFENLNYLDTSNVTNMRAMFFRAESLKSLDLSSFNMSNVTNTNNMFALNRSLENLNTAGWDTSKIQNMDTMFSATNFKELNLEHWNTSSVTSMRDMFAGNKSLEKLSVSTWDTRNVTMMSSFLEQASSLKTLDLSGWTTSSSTNVVAMFSSTDSLWKITLPSTFNNLYITGLASLDPNRTDYTDKWQSVGNGTDTQPNGQYVLTGRELTETFKGATMADTYVWQPKAPVMGQVNVRYVAQGGNAVAPTKVISGIEGTPYDVSTPDYKLVIPGYTLDESILPTNAIGLLTSSVSYQDVVYVYNQPAADVTVRYVDQAGNELAPSKTISGVVDDSYDTTTADYKKTIAGYTLDESQLPSNKTGTLGVNPQTVNYVYKKKTIPSGGVKVRYVDQQGNELAPSKAVEGNVGTPYDVTTSDYRLVLPGYELDQNQVLLNGTGIFSEDTQTVSYVYKQIIEADPALNVTVRYVDEDGNEIRLNKTISGYVGDPFDATTSDYKLAVPGYTLDETQLPSNGTGTLSGNYQTVTYKYTKNPLIAADVTVRYVDQSGNELNPSKTISGNIGDAYDATTSTYKLTIAGYTLNASLLPTNGTGTLSANAQTVTYIYTKNVVTAADVTVRYVDQSGNEITPSKAISGNIGDAYDVTTSTYKLTIAGYTLNASLLPTNGTGTLSANAQTVTYIYTKNVVTAADVTVRYVD